jgi:hypothetical protein
MFGKEHIFSNLTIASLFDTNVLFLSELSGIESLG